jgi:teichoic acid transport system permease protein
VPHSVNQSTQSQDPGVPDSSGPPVATLDAQPQAAPARPARPGAAGADLGQREHHVFRSRSNGAPKLHAYIAELWARREFIQELSRCTLRAQNYLNAFGQLWLVLNPLLLGTVYFILVDIINRGKHAPDFFTMLLGGLFLYNFFSGIIGQSAGSIIGSSRLVLNSRLPRLVLPITQIAIAFMRFLPSMLVFLEMTLFAAGLGFICATLQVYFRDFANFLPYALRIWLYLSPVLWPLSQYAGKHGFRVLVIGLNPLSPIIGTWGNALVYNTTPPISWLIEGAGWALASFVLGLYVFTRREREFSVRL